MASAETAVIDPTAPFYVFPPFPIAVGKALISFKGFKPKGIRPLDPESDEVEVDGDGIPTLTLGIQHTSGKHEGAKRKKKKKKTHLTKDMPFVTMPWWEEWEQADTSRPATHYDPNMDRASRFHQLSQEFLSSRKFTPSLQSLWDHFRFFVGLIAKPVNQLPHQKKAANPEEAELDDFSDEDADVYAGFQRRDDIDAPTTDSLIGSSAVLQSADLDEAQEIRMNSFLDYPEQSIKIFLSSYSYDRGFQLNPSKSRDSPILVSYVLQYILRHKAFPESEKTLRLAYDVAEKAKVELPSTRKISAVIPEGWNRACMALWGSIETGCATGFWNSSAEKASADVAMKEFEEEIQKADISNFVTEADLAKDAIADNLDPENPLVDSSQWDPPNPNVSSGWDNVTAIGDDTATWGEPSQAAQEWGTPLALDSMLPFVGPSSIPVTHKPIRAEQSTRRIISFTRPSDASESYLSRRLVTVHLGPWIKPKEGTSVPPPRMLLDEGEGILEPHNAKKDEINVFVDANVVDSLRVGLGITGVWVQVIQTDDEDLKETRKGSPLSPNLDGDKVWWYVESVRSVVPSYWMDV